MVIIHYSYYQLRFTLYILFITLWKDIVCSLIWILKGPSSRGKLVMSEGNEHFISSESALSKLIKNYSKKLISWIISQQNLWYLIRQCFRFIRPKPFTVDWFRSNYYAHLSMFYFRATEEKVFNLLDQLCDIRHLHDHLCCRVRSSLLITYLLKNICIQYTSEHLSLHIWKKKKKKPNAKSIESKWIFHLSMIFLETQQQFKPDQIFKVLSFLIK